MCISNCVHNCIQTAFTIDAFLRMHVWTCIRSLAILKLQSKMHSNCIQIAIKLHSNCIRNRIWNCNQNAFQLHSNLHSNCIRNRIWNCIRKNKHSDCIRKIAILNVQSWACNLERQKQFLGCIPGGSRAGGEPANRGRGNRGGALPHTANKKLSKNPYRQA